MNKNKEDYPYEWTKRALSLSASPREEVSIDCACFLDNYEYRWVGEPRVSIVRYAESCGNYLKIPVVHPNE